MIEIYLLLYPGNYRFEKVDYDKEARARNNPAVIPRLATTNLVTDEARYQRLYGLSTANERRSPSVT